MDALKVIIFDSHFNYESKYNDIISKFGLKNLCNVKSIEELNTIINKLSKIDLIIINHQTDGLNLVNIKAEIRNIKNKSKAIILISSIYNSCILNYLYNLGIDYIIHKNNLIEEFELVLKIVLNEIPLELINIKADYKRNLKLKADIKKHLNDINLPIKLSGYNYLALAIELVYLNPNLGFAASKQLYPLIAKTYDSNFQRVERSIRNIIKKVDNPESEYYQASNLTFIFKSIESLKRNNVE